MTPGSTAEKAARKPRAVREKTPRPLVGREPLADPSQVAAYVGRPEKTLEYWRYKGTGPRFIRIDGGVRYRWSDVDAWLDARTVETEEAA